MRSATKTQHGFSRIPNAEIQRSSFNRSFGHKTTFDAGWLIPVICDEALPGDTFNCRMHTFARLATPLHPVMDNMYLDSFFFAVPMRLLWDNWEKFNGQQTDPGDTTDYLIPQANTGAGVVNCSLSDYIGIPQGAPDLDYSCLWHRAYNLIWNEWFRDQNLQDSVTVNTDDGPDTYSYVKLKRGKRKDYFTSCLPWPQKGDPVMIPIGSDTAPVIGTGTLQPIFDFPTGGTSVGLTTDAGLNTTWTGTPGTGAAQWKTTELVADLSSATAATINTLRQAFQIQRLYERDARGGSRYTEIIRSHFGVTSPDQRLQRPEYLGGGSQNISVTPVPQTSATEAETPQGNLAAYGVTSGSNHTFTKSFTEHCLIIGMVSVRADLNYQRGLERQFSRKTRWDFYWPALSHLGEQAVLNKEIYALGAGNDDDGVFGYQERFAEYRYKPSQISGQFRSIFAQSLDTWHLAQDFISLPTLGPTFINEAVPIARIVAVQSEPQFLFDSFFDMKCARPMPTYSVPGLIDHF